MSKDTPRKTSGVYMSGELFKVFTIYASKHKPKLACEIWENALTEYMKNHPSESATIIIQQQIKSVLPGELEQIQMTLLEREIRFIVNRMPEATQNVKPDLVKRLGRLMIKGTEIKKPTAEFVELLKEGMKHIRSI